MERYAFALFALCALLWIGAWGRLAVNTVTTAAPAGTVIFTDAQGRPVAGDLTCHGPALVEDDALWQICQHRSDAAPEHGQQSTFVRFEPAARRATLVAKSPPEPVFMRGAVARHPDGGLVYVIGTDVLHLSASGLSSLGQLPPGRGHGIAWNETLEVAYMRGDGVGVVARRTPRGAWQQEEITSPETAEGWQLRFEGVYRAEPGADGQRPWRFVWLRAPEMAELGVEVGVDFVESGPDLGPTTTQTLRYVAEAVTTRGRVRVGPEGYLILGYDRWLDRRSAGDVVANYAMAPLERRDGRWVEPTLPAPIADEPYELDYVVGQAGLQPVRRFSGPWLNYGERWFVLRGDRDVALVEVDPAQPAGAPLRAGPPVVHRFWLEPGLKLLPASDGWWLMGSLGAALVQLDGDLARRDSLGFGQRLLRALDDDKAKRNADFYHRYATLKRAGFVWVLLAFPLLVLPALGWSRRRGRLGFFGLAAGGCALGTLAAAPTFWALSGVFW